MASPDVTNPDGATQAGRTLAELGLPNVKILDGGTASCDLTTIVGQLRETEVRR